MQIRKQRITGFRITKIKSHKYLTNIKCMIDSNLGNRVTEERTDVDYVSRYGKSPGRF